MILDSDDPRWQRDFEASVSKWEPIFRNWETRYDITTLVKYFIEAHNSMYFWHGDINKLEIAGHIIQANPKLGAILFEKAVCNFNSREALVFFNAWLQEFNNIPEIIKRYREIKNIIKKSTNYIKNLKSEIRKIAENRILQLELATSSPPRVYKDAIKFLRKERPFFSFSRSIDSSDIYSMLKTDRERAMTEFNRYAAEVERKISSKLRRGGFTFAVPRNEMPISRHRVYEHKQEIKEQKSDAISRVVSHVTFHEHQTIRLPRNEALISEPIFHEQKQEFKEQKSEEEPVHSVRFYDDEISASSQAVILQSLIPDPLAPAPATESVSTQGSTEFKHSPIKKSFRQRLEELGLKEEDSRLLAIYEKYKDSVDYELMDEPFSLKCGHTLDKRTAVRCSCCPMCKTSYKSDDLRENYFVKSLIDEEISKLEKECKHVIAKPDDAILFKNPELKI